MHAALAADVNQKFAAIVLAGQRAGPHPVAIAAGVAAAVLAPIGGKPMLGRVLEALASADRVVGGLIVGNGLLLDSSVELARVAQSGGFRVVPAQAGPSASATAAVEAVGRFPCLITTGDHPLLTAAIVDEFCVAALQTGADFAVAVVQHSDVMARLPSTRRTSIRFADGAICGCNLFATCTPAGVQVLRLWQRIEADRKRPWRVIRLLGLRSLVAFLLGRLTAAAALTRLSTLAGCQVRFVRLSRPEMAVDVDSVADWRLAEQIFSERQPAAASSSSW